MIQAIRFSPSTSTITWKPSWNWLMSLQGRITPTPVGDLSSMRPSRGRSKDVQTNVGSSVDHRGCCRRSVSATYSVLELGRIRKPQRGRVSVSTNVGCAPTPCSIRLRAIRGNDGHQDSFFRDLVVLSKQSAWIEVFAHHERVNGNLWFQKQASLVLRPTITWQILSFNQR